MKTLLCVGIVLLLAGAYFFTRNSQPDYSQRSTLSGMVPRALSSAVLVKHVDPNKVIEVTMGLKLKNVDDLKKLIDNQADPKSADFHRYLSPDDAWLRYCPTQDEYDQVIAYLKSQNLTVVETAPNRLVVTVSATAAQIEKAFGVKLNQYRWHGQEYLSNDKEPSVPTCIAGSVRSVMGLNTFAQFHAPPRKMKLHGESEPFGFNPQQIATNYDFPNSNNNAKGGTVYSGKGVTVAIVSAESYNPKDVETYWKQFGIVRTGKVENIPIGNLTAKDNDETTLDLEQLGSQAPGADILMYLSPDPEDSSFARVFNHVLTDHRASIISYSWGASEGEVDSAAVSTFDSIFMLAYVQGMTVCAASGDNGAYDFHDKNKKGILSVDFPSSDPYVLAVGGTHLLLNDDYHRQSERAWTGSGGGISSLWPRPSWQYGPGVPAGDKRLTADVSMFADPWFGYTFYFQGEWQALSGGTSFAAPNWAALLALAEEANGGRVGSVSSAIYRIGRSADYGNIFYDVTQGDNGDGQGDGYRAGPNWDYPTGWGVPNARALVDWLKEDNKKKTN
jgi:kumamolisin